MKPKQSTAAATYSNKSWTLKKKKKHKISGSYNECSQIRDSCAHCVGTANGRDLKGWYWDNLQCMSSFLQCLMEIRHIQNLLGRHTEYAWTLF